MKRVSQLTALAMLCGFAAATGPAFADMGYDLKAGWILRGNGKNPAFELDGRRQQFLAASMAFLIAIPVVAFVYQDFFSQGLVPPVAKVYIAAIQAGVSFDIAKSLLIWAIPGALIQFIGGPSRQMGVLLATWPSYQQCRCWLGRFRSVWAFVSLCLRSRGQMPAVRWKCLQPVSSPATRC